MFKWIKKFHESSRQTKYFILTWLIFGLCIVVSTVYCYARLDYVRSYKKIEKKLDQE